MNQPVIGVLPLVDIARESYWMLPGYMLALSQAGALPLMLPLEMDPPSLERALALCDGFLLTGGQDVDPARYGAAKSSRCGEISSGRDALEAALIDRALQERKALFGICRGIQMLNVALGGTLYQDLPSEYASNVNHSVTGRPWDRVAHRVELVGASPLHQLLGVQTLGVNSRHHQAVKDLAPGLEVMAISEDGLVEAVRLPGAAFVWAVQWHPEYSYPTDAASRKLFAAFVQAAAAGSRR